MSVALVFSVVLRRVGLCQLLLSVCCVCFGGLRQLLLSILPLSGFPMAVLDMRREGALSARLLSLSNVCCPCHF